MQRDPELAGQRRDPVARPAWLGFAPSSDFFRSPFPRAASGSIGTGCLPYSYEYVKYDASTRFV